MTTIVVRNLINSQSATSPEKAKPLYNAIVQSIEKKEQVTIDFSDLTTITTAFFNSSIGNLYSAYSPDVLNKFVKIDANSLTDLQYEKLKLVMSNAKSKLTKEDIQEEID